MANFDNSSILFTIKPMLGLDPDYDPFDLEVMVHINAAFTMLKQLGVGPDKGFKITGPEETWDEFLSDDTLVEWAKQFIYLRVRKIFDPPASSAVAKALEEEEQDLRWRMVVMAEGGDEDE